MIHVFTFIYDGAYVRPPTGVCTLVSGPLCGEHVYLGGCLCLGRRVCRVSRVRDRRSVCFCGPRVDSSRGVPPRVCGPCVGKFPGCLSTRVHRPSGPGSESSSTSCVGPTRDAGPRGSMSEERGSRVGEGNTSGPTPQGSRLFGSGGGTVGGPHPRRADERRHPRHTSRHTGTRPGTGETRKD